MKSQNSRIKVFLTIFAYERRIRIQEAPKHMEPTDPDSDPQYWFISTSLILLCVPQGAAGPRAELHAVTPADGRGREPRGRGARLLQA
jgi:hypothetical protein